LVEQNISNDRKEWLTVYSSNAGRIVSGGSAAADVSGMPLFILPAVFIFFLSQVVQMA